MVHNCNPSTEKEGLHEFQANLNYIRSCLTNSINGQGLCSSVEWPRLKFSVAPPQNHILGNQGVLSVFFFKFYISTFLLNLNVNYFKNKMSIYLL